MRSMYTKLRGRVAYATTKHYGRWRVCESQDEINAREARARALLAKSRRKAAKQNHKQRKRAKRAELQCAPVPLNLRKLTAKPLTPPSPPLAIMVAGKWVAAAPGGRD